jgi:hypothetical protein
MKPYSPLKPVRAPARRACPSTPARSGRPHTRAQGLRAELGAATAAAAAAAQAAAAAEAGAAAERARHGEEASALRAALDQARGARAGGGGAPHASAMSPEALVAGRTNDLNFLRVQNPRRPVLFCVRAGARRSRGGAGAAGGGGGGGRGGARVHAGPAGAAGSDAAPAHSSQCPFAEALCGALLNPALLP